MSGMKLEVGRQIKDGTCYLSFKGCIDEDFNFEQLTQEKLAKYLIDFNQVEMINSCGIREWILFLEKLGKESQIIYVNCPQFIVQQINMVEGFLNKNSAVHTFFGPYYCEECDNEKKVLIKTAEMIKQNELKAPAIKCDSCENNMEFDAHEKQYFSFLQKQKKAS
jgi:anti-anti-sigma regulatory factor